MNTSSPIALVTGGSRGLGRSTVLNLAKRGVHSIFTYRSNHTEAEKVASLVREAGAQALALELDTGNVSAFDGFVAAVRKTLQSWGR
jgi:NAD(P)-dependent dehydrogenase (short-subunit alcohol dehydrogenase family)